MGTGVSLRRIATRNLFLSFMAMRLRIRRQISLMPSHLNSNTAPTFALSRAFLRKEVIQPQVLLRLPCYDFTLIICPTLDGWLQKVTPPALGVTNSHGVTGGVYKARERIHRGMLIRDY